MIWYQRLDKRAFYFGISGKAITNPLTNSATSAFILNQTPLAEVELHSTPELLQVLHLNPTNQQLISSQFFYLIILNLARFLIKGDTDIQVINGINAWNHSDFLRRNYALNGLSDSLYNIYTENKKAKEQWK